MSANKENVGVSHLDITHDVKIVELASFVWSYGLFLSHVLLAVATAIASLHSMITI